MRYGVRFPLMLSWLLAAGAGCAPIDGHDDVPIEPIPLSGRGGAAGQGGGAAGAGGQAGGGEAGAGQGGSANLDLIERLRAIAGVADVEELEPTMEGARPVTFTIEQPIDHARPEAG